MANSALFRSNFLRFESICMNRFFVIHILTAILAINMTLGAQDRPHILLINVDDWGYKDAGFMGSEFYETPNIDQLSKSGMVFTQAYAAAANCAPSRACLMTGLYSPRHGIYTVGKSARGKAKDRRLIPTPNETTLKQKFLTLAEMLSESGYETATLGKWHLSNDPLPYGFDINVGGTHRGHPASYFSPYRNPSLSDGPKGEHLTDRITDEAIGILRAPREKPLFMYLPYFAVHTPLQGKQELIRKYESKATSVPAGQRHATYAAMVETLDANIGRLLHTLRDLDMEKETIVILTSDNGGIRAVSSQHPLRAGKGSYYEGGIRVPLVVSWPGRIEADSKCDVPVINIDFFPTLQNLVKGKASQPLDGINLSPLWFGEEAFPDRSLYWHFPIYLQAYKKNADDGRDPLFRTRPGSVIRSGKWKLHEYFEDGGIELYDLESDPGERNNLVDAHPDNQTTTIKRPSSLAHENWGTGAKEAKSEVCAVRVDEERQLVFRGIIMNSIRKFGIGFIVVFGCVGSALSSDDAARLRELDAYWDTVSKAVREGDFESYKATCHDEGVLVSISKKTSQPISEALARWKQGFLDTKSGKIKANVEFRFSQRLGDHATAHETGMFYYSTVDAKGKRTDDFIHFEGLLVKQAGHWKILMEYQKTKATKKEWESLK